MIYVPIKNVRIYLRDIGIENVGILSDKEVYKVYVNITKQYDAVVVDKNGNDISAPSNVIAAQD